MSNYWDYKKANFKSIDGLQVYAGYLFGEFKGYYYKSKRYQLVSKRTAKGIVLRERFVGYGYLPFHRRNADGTWQTWEEWKAFQLSYDDTVLT